MEDEGRATGWLRLALSPTIVRRGLGYAVVVGAILILINHGDALLRGEITASRAWRMGLTVFVPYMVSTLSSVGAIRAGADSRSERVMKKPLSEPRP